MNKQDYITNLKIQLKDETYDTVCQVVEYYEEIIDDLIEEGWDEEDVIRNLKEETPSFEVKQLKKKSSLYLTFCLLLVLGFVLTYMSYQKIMSVSIKSTRKLKIIGLSLLRNVRIVCKKRHIDCGYR